MRKVIDANCLDNPVLEEFLKSDPENMAVLTEYAGMEVHKGNPVENVCQTMKILCQHPMQVIILKGTRQIVLENQTPDVLDVTRFVDEDQTTHFPEFCEVVGLARNGNPLAIDPIIEHGKVASAEMDRLRSDAMKTSQGIEALITTFSPNQLRILRKNAPIPRELATRIMRDILTLTALLIRRHPDTLKMPTAHELKYTYTFRYSLCCYLLGLEYLKSGGLNKVRPERMRNDMVDMSYAAYATLFDGIITKDIKLNRIYQKATGFLNHVFA